MQPGEQEAKAVAPDPREVPPTVELTGYATELELLAWPYVRGSRLEHQWVESRLLARGRLP